jgi:hypothetical protein
MSSPTREASNLQEPFESLSSLQNLQNQSHRQKSCNFESIFSVHAVKQSSCTLVWTLVSTEYQGLLTKLLLWPEAIPTLYQYQLPHRV